MSRTHRCPAEGCEQTVPDAIFCCAEDWFLLPLNIQTEIRHTALLPVLHPDRRDAINRAMAHWRVISL